MPALRRAAAARAERDHCARHVERRKHFGYCAVTPRDLRELVLVDDQHVDEPRADSPATRDAGAAFSTTLTPRVACRARECGDGFERSLELQQEIADAVERRQIRRRAASRWRPARP